ncbi:MAG: DUF6497 family protein [Paracoccaceae bacterium]
MRLAQIALCLVFAAAPASAEEKITLPSGRTVTYFETVSAVTGPEGLTYRFRFVDPTLVREDDGGGEDDQTADPSIADSQMDGEDQGGVIFNPEGGAGDAQLKDMTFLCETFALARLPNLGPQAQQVIISIADRPVPFGEPDPDVVQVFEAFRPEGKSCVWEGF